MSARRDVERTQRRWAAAADVAVDAQGFVRDAASNLRVPLSGAATRDFARGSELAARGLRPARIAALRSSAALVANVFDYWTTRDCAALLAALGFPGGAVVSHEESTDGAAVAQLAFEEPVPTGVAGDPPTLDVALRLRSGYVVAIESKFTEWLVRRPRHKAVFKPKYFPPGRALWRERGLEACQTLAEGLQTGRERCKHLHAAQLLKHALGLAALAPGAHTIVYLYYHWPCREAQIHRAELARFAALTAGELPLRALTYQSLYAALAAEAVTDRVYLDYLGARYFQDASAGGAAESA